MNAAAPTTGFAVAGRTRCLHCGTTFEAAPTDAPFCSPACAAVHERIVGENLEDFYLFSRGKSDPAPSRIFHPGRDADLATQIEALETSGRSNGEFAVDGISCLGCAWLIEELFSRQPGAIECRVSPASGQARLSWEMGRCDVVAFARQLHGFGYVLAPAGARAARKGDGFSRRLGLCAAFAMNAMLFTLPSYLGMEPGDRLAGAMLPVTAACATASVLVGGSYFIRRAWHGLRVGSLHIDLPIAIGIIAAYAGSIAAVATGHPHNAYFDFVSVFTFLMLAGRWIQESAVNAARTRLANRSFQPGPVALDKVAGHGELFETTAGASHEQIGAGTEYSLAAGGTVPTRSTLVSASAEFSLDWIDGEPKPRTYATGALIPSGAGLIGPDGVKLRSVEDWKGSLLDQLTAAKPEAEGRLHTSVERYIRVYMIAVMLLSTFGALAWLVAGRPEVALHVFISVLVVSCPCALGIAVPLADQFAAAALRRRGVHVRDASVWSRLEKTRVVALDKTGTLTRNTLQLVDVTALDQLGSEDAPALAAMTSASLHPVSRCLREELAQRMPDVHAASGRIHESVGEGLELTDGEETWRLGRPNWALHNPSSGIPGTVLSRNGIFIARFEFTERIRDDASRAIDAIRSSGREIIVLSGDHQARVTSIAGELGISADAVRASLSPAEKAAIVRDYPRDAVLMIGDGGNDSLAFAAAACRGAPASDRGLLESRSDFFLTGDRLGGIADLFTTVAARSRCIRGLMIFTLTYNVCVVGLALAGLMNPLLAAVLMPLSSITALGLVATLTR